MSRQASRGDKVSLTSHWRNGCHDVVCVSRYPSRRSVRMTRRLIFWRTSAMSASLGGSDLDKARLEALVGPMYVCALFKEIMR